MKKIVIVIISFFTLSVVHSQTITIGKQVWTTQNLDVDKFRNGDPIPEAKTNKEWVEAGIKKEPAWCYYDNDPENGKKYGKLYNWYAVNDPRGLAPEGFHIPNKLEWEELTDFLGGWRVAGKKMKSNSGWYKEGNGTNESGFNGLQGGLRYVNGDFRITGGWWSSTEANDSGSSFFCGLFNLYDFAIIDKDNAKEGFSVRCLRN